MKLTPKQLSFINANYLTITGSDMARMFKVSRSTVNVYKRNNHLQSPIEVTRAGRKGTIENRDTSTPEVDKIIRKKFLKVSVKELVKLTGKSRPFLLRRMAQLNLITPPELIAQRKAEFQLKPGNIPPNKGKKVSAEAYTRSKPTMFKPGNIPHNTLSDGVITTRHEHSDANNTKAYKYIRLAINEWQPLHVYNWVKKFGPVPEGKCVSFIAGNDCAIENLELITRTENMERNSIMRFPPILRSTIMLNATLKRTITKIETNGIANIK